MSPFTDRQERALCRIIDLWGTNAVVLVGGTALSAQNGMPWRTTLDLDLAIAIDTGERLDALEREEGWEKDPDVEHRWTFEGRVQVDIVPAGPAAVEAGALTWPRSGNVMNLTGFDLAFEHTESIAIGQGTLVRVPQVPVILLLKMAAFLDRPHERRRDLTDIAWLLHGYVGEFDERRFEERFQELDLSYHEVPAFLLGEDLKRVTTARHQAVVTAFLDFIDQNWLIALAVGGPAEWNGSPEEAHRQLEAFRRGMQERGPER